MSDNETVVWDKRLESLMKLLIHKKGLQQRQAAEVGKKVVTIFRGKDFVEFLTKQENFQNIVRRCPQLTKGVDEISLEQATVWGNELINNGFVARAVGKVLKIDPSKIGENEDANRRKKWPEKILRLPLTEQEFEPASLYIVLYEGSKTMQHVFSALAIVGVLVACMFPAWPVWAKIAVWYVVFWMSSSLLAILVIRMVLYVCLWTVGVDFWWFPNILDEYAGIVDSFRPFYSFERRKDGYGMAVIRVVAMGVIALATYEFAQHNSWEDIRNFAKNSISDILDWGTDKLTALPQPKNQYLSIADIEKMTDTTIPPETVDDFFDEMQEF